MSKRFFSVLCVMVALFAACGDDGPDMTSPGNTAPGGVTASAGPATVEIEETFTARITKKDLAEFDYVPQDWPGEWTLIVQADSYVLEYTNFRVTEVIAASEDEIAITATPAPAGAFNCYTEDDVRLTGEGEASGLYSYELTGKTFELTAEEEPCELRRALLERAWKVGS